ncbi:hypothetical protein LTR95_007248 [Oleoguttula sp. CCFEE 5521]
MSSYQPYFPTNSSSYQAIHQNRDAIPYQQAAPYYHPTQLQSLPNKSQYHFPSQYPQVDAYSGPSSTSRMRGPATAPGDPSVRTTLVNAQENATVPQYVNDLGHGIPSQQKTNSMPKTSQSTSSGSSTNAVPAGLEQSSLGATGIALPAHVNRQMSPSQSMKFQEEPSAKVDAPNVPSYGSAMEDESQTLHTSPQYPVRFDVQQPKAALGLNALGLYAPRSQGDTNLVAQTMVAGNMLAITSGERRDTTQEVQDSCTTESPFHWRSGVLELAPSGRSAHLTTPDTALSQTEQCVQRKLVTRMHSLKMESLLQAARLQAMQLGRLMAVDAELAATVPWNDEMICVLGVWIKQYGGVSVKLTDAIDALCTFADVPAQ